MEEWNDLELENLYEIEDIPTTAIEIIQKNITEKKESKEERIIGIEEEKEETILLEEWLNKGGKTI